MAGNVFNVDTPRGTMFVTQSKSGRVKVEMEWAARFGPDREASFGRKQEFIDQECIRRMAPETPRLTGVLVKSATLGTVIGTGKIYQIAPYARRQYYEHKEKSLWFERMKNRHKDSILRGAQKIE